MEKTIEQLEEEIKQRQADSQKAYETAKAQAEVKEMSEMITDSNKAIQTKLNIETAKVIDESEEIKKKIGKTADILVDKGLQTQENKAKASVMRSENETLEADFEKNKDEYLFHGIDHKIDKEWKRKIIHAINDVWFVIWAIVSCFTIVPVSTFLSRIKALKGIVKGVAIIIGIIMLLAILGGVTVAILKRCGVF